MVYGVWWDWFLREGGGDNPLYGVREGFIIVNIVMLVYC